MIDRQPGGISRLGRTASGAAGLVLALGLSNPPGGAAGLAVRTEIRHVLDPVAIIHAGDGTGRLFVAQRDGLILVREPRAHRAEPFLDLRPVVDCCVGESGLLGLAFHPDYAVNGLFFVNYTLPHGDSVVSRYQVSEDPGRADPDSALEILRIEQPGPFHNSAQLAFGPDGFLYIGSGDGASDGDREDRAQSLESLLGKILRIDVDQGPVYGVPDDNPFLTVREARREIWAYGLRNPWRFSFDRQTGDLYLGDVGQNRFEEIDFQPAASPGGENYGWRTMEGQACFSPSEGCRPDGLTPPIFSYAHSTDPKAACSGSVTGGVRYRGPPAATLSGLYVFGDFCSGEIWGGRRNGAGNWLFRRLLATDLRITSFGEDERGRLLVAALGRRVYALRGRPLFTSDFSDPKLADWSRRKGRPRTRAAGLGDGAGALRLVLDGNPRRIFLRSREPDGEEFLRVAFDLRLDHARLGSSPLEILRLTGEAPLLSLFLEADGDAYQVRVAARESDGAKRPAGTARLEPGTMTRLGIDWMRAVGPELADGEVVLYRDGREVARSSDLATGGQAVDSVLLGLPAGAAGTDGGVLLIDGYWSSR